MNKRFTFAVTLVWVLFSCTYDTLEETRTKSGIVIKTGTVCGWCARNDTLSITGNWVRYVNYVNCNAANPAVQKFGEISQTDFENLVKLLDFNSLEKIDLNTCNVCVDGCDTWLLVEKGTESHYIKFGGTESELQPIQAFIDRLNQIKSQYSSED